MRSLRLAMIAHDIPQNWTARLTAVLGISGVEDLADLSLETIMLVPTEFRQRIIDLRNFYAPGNMTLLYWPADMV
jgi:hypothetical protein